MEYEVTWISDRLGIQLKINPNEQSIKALKKFIEVLETGVPGSGILEQDRRG